MAVLLVDDPSRSGGQVRDDVSSLPAQSRIHRPYIEETHLLSSELLGPLADVDDTRGDRHGRDLQIVDDVHPFLRYRDFSYPCEYYYC